MISKSNAIRCAALLAALLFPPYAYGQQTDEKPAPVLEKSDHRKFNFFPPKATKPFGVSTLTDRVMGPLRPNAFNSVDRIEYTSFGPFVIEHKTFNKAPEQYWETEKQTIRPLLRIGTLNIPVLGKNWSCGITGNIRLGHVKDPLEQARRGAVIRILFTKPYGEKR